MPPLYKSHTERLATGGRVSVSPEGTGTRITVHGCVRDPVVHDPRPPQLVLSDLRRQGLHVEIA